MNRPGRPVLLRRAWSAGRLRWKRRKLIWRAIRAGRVLTPVADRTAAIRPGDILLFTTLRNEMQRLPEFLAHYRQLGVRHVLAVDNASTDGSAEFLRAQPDVSLWSTPASYREARFGLDWMGMLLLRHGHGHWCVCADADELLVYPHCDSHDLRALTAHLDARGIPGMGALMLDLYPRGPLDQPSGGGSVTEELPFFDAGPYPCQVMQPRRNRWVQGGVRQRVFFADRPQRAPTLNKLPLIRWHWRYAYVNSTHSMLPPRLNDLYDGPGDPRLSGVLLHSKFLPGIVERSREELGRRQHFADPDAYAGYHRALTEAPVLWHPGSLRYRDWRQLAELGLMGGTGWTD
ncbi:glycosyltransferase family 2 protein [Paracoccus sp. TOH]|uniref:Glycosyltransferase family 2 protein n=1 Tax=Paracoccus simplex TaxID=2086346 RepID=A0ABV7S1T4_9RHOB|nr:glycosyltransferase family 2 protein [Paracoccus sp. TOH]WJS83392.1 glycosyltransferase family 2 protein [Paracoccus sp. TOH]